MNKAHRIVWSEVQQAFVVVSEVVRSCGKSRSSLALRNALGAPALALRALPAALWVGGLISVVAAAAYATPPAPSQLPTGGQVVAGQASIGQSSAVMDIQQTTNRAAIDWQTFNVGSGAQVNFRQPDSSSVTLNRVQDANPSQIFGRITANGQVFLSNPNGAYFSPTASVDVGGLLATTHRISLTDFMAGNSRFTRDGARGNVVNEGELKATLGGYIALLAPEVRNTGVIVANLGTVALAAGDAFELQFDSNNTLSSLRVTPSTIQALVDNRSAVLAPGGLIILSALAVNQVQGSVVQNSGTLEASSVSQQGGRIILEGDHITLASGALLDASGNTGGGTVLIGGDWQGSGDMHQATTVTMEAGASIRADATVQGAGGKVVLWSDITRADSVTTFGGSISAQGGVSGDEQGARGGQVETSGAQLTVQETARVDTRVQLQDGTSLVGSWLLDPRDFTVGSGRTGTVTAGTPSGDISGATLSTALATSNVTLLSSQGSTVSGAGNININDAVSWSTNRLTLTAANNVNINAVMTASGNSTLTMNANTANGGDAAVSSGRVLVGLGPNGFAGRVDFGGRSGSGILTINAENYTVISSLGAQGSSTGTDLQGMKGSLTTNYALGTNIDAAATAGWTNTFEPVGRNGLQFSGKFNGLGNTISNLTVDAAKQGNDRFGLFGEATSAISNVGLVGGSIGFVTTNGNRGGALVGLLAGTVSNSYSNGVNVKGFNNIGGLVGYKTGSGVAVVGSYVTGAGSVQGFDYVGGLIGYGNGPTQVTTSYTTVPISGQNYVGGLVGKALGFEYGTNTNTIVDSYSTGTVVGALDYVGGVAGYVQGGLTRTYAAGRVEGGGGSVVITTNGGLAGAADEFAQITNSYWNSTQTTRGLGFTGGSGGTLVGSGALTEAQMRVQSNFIGFNFTSPWSMVSGYNNGFPALCGFGCTIQAFIRPTAGSSTYGTAPNISYSLVDSTGSALTLSNATVSGTALYSGAPTATSNAGNYSISYASGLALGGSNASLYSLTAWATPVTWTVNKLALNLTGTKTYDGTANFAAGTLTASNLLFGACASGLAACGLTGSATVASARVAAGVQTLGLGGLALGGTINTNYTLTGFTGSGSITAATLTPTLSNTSVTKTYDGNTTAPSGFVPTYSFSGLAAGDTAATLTNTGASYNSAHVATANTLTVGGLALTGITGSNNSALSDYVLAANSSSVAATITAKTLTSSATIGGTLTKTYDGNTSAAGSTLSGSVSGAIAGDALTLDTSGQTLAYNDAHVLAANAILASGTSAFTISATGSGSLASDYSFTGPNIAAATASITARALTSTAIIGGTLTKTYDGNTSASGATLSGIVSGAIAGDTLTLNTAGQTLAYNSARVLTANSILASGTSAFAISSTGSSSLASDYSFTGPTIAAATASISAKTVALSASKVYDGTTSLAGAVTVSTGVGSETLDTSGATASDAHVLSTGKFINAITLTDGTGPNAGLASDYQLPTLSSITAPVTITPASLAVSMSNSAVTKTYDGTTNAPIGFMPTYNVTGLVSGDTAATFSAGAVLYNNANVASATTLQASGLALGGITGSNASVAGDYTLSNTSASVAATITRAPLAVRANNDARFVTLADTANFNGVSFTGLVNGETAATAVGSGPYTVTRPNFGTDVSAGVYSGALVPGSLASDNYSLSYVNGIYTIVPAGQLLVRVTNNTNVYGGTAAYAGNGSLVSAQYLDGGNTIQTLAAPTINNTNYAYNDGAGNLFNFNITPFTTGVSPVPVSNSTAGKTPVGSWQMGATSLTGTTTNFSNNLTVVGMQTVTPKSVAISTGGVSKTYDGNVSMTGLTVGLSGLESSDVVTVAGNGAFSSKDANTNLNYTVSGLQLTGTDSANYVLSGGNAFSGSDGTITPKTVTLSANKTYDGSTSLSSAVTLNTGISGESLSYTGATASSARVAAAGKFINAITLEDGSGGLASNYVLPTLDASNAPVTITAKALTSTAGISGNLSKTYDGTDDATGATVSGSVQGAVSGDTLTLNTTGVTLAYNSARVATATRITATGSAALNIVGSAAGSEATDYNFTAPGISDVVASITPKTLTSTLTNTGVTKVYDGNTSAPGGFTPSYDFSGLVAGDTSASLSNTAATYNSARVANATTLTVSGLAVNAITGIHGSVASDYVLDASSKSVAATIITKALTSSAAIGGTLTKTYDGNTSASGATLSGSVDGAIAGDTLTLNTAGQTLAYNSARVVNATQVAASGTSSFTIGATNSGSVASDYSFTGPTIAAATGGITAKALTSTASIGGTLTKTYDGNTSASGATLSGSVSGAIAGDTLTLDTTGQTLAYNSARVLAANSILASGTAAFAISSTGSSSLASDYSFTGPTIAAATASISAKALTSTASIGGTLTKTYDGNTSAGGATLSGTVSGAIAGDTLSLNTSALTLDYNSARVLAASSILASGTAGFTISTTGSSSLASDYSFSGPTIASVAGSISARALTSTATIGGTLTKTYDGTTSASGAVVSGTVSGAIAGDTLTLDTSGQTLAYNSARVLTASTIQVSGTTGFSISSTGSNSQTSDYSFTGPTIASVAGSITAATLTPTLTNTGVTKVYDGTDAAPVGFSPTYAIAGFIAGDSAATLSNSAVAFDSARAANTRKVVVSGLGVTGITGSNHSLISDYVLDASTIEVAASITPKTVSLSASKTYDASADLMGAVTLATGISGETLQVAAATANSRNVGNGNFINSITLANGSGAGLATDYQLPVLNNANAPVTINPLGLNLAGATGVSKTYDATTDLPSGVQGYGTLTGVISGDGVSLSGAPQFSSANAGNVLIESGSLILSGPQSGNYSLQWSNSNATINKASLSVQVNNDAKLFSQTDSINYNGAVYDGWVGGESEAVLGGTLNIVRSNAGVDAAGVYNGVLVGSGLTATNYTLSFVNGNYTIVPASQLLVKVTPLSRLYGNTPSYTVSSAAYLASDNTTINTLPVTRNSSNSFTIDGTTILISPSGAPTSTSGNITAGGYQLGGAVASGSSANFSNNLVVTGALQVLQKGITSNATKPVSKVYDGTTATGNAPVGLNSTVTGDVVTASGTGEFSGRNVGTDLGYTIRGITLSGADASNYFISGGSNVSGSNGQITPRTLLVVFAGDNKVYDGNTSATVTTTDDRVTGDTVVVARSAAFVDKNVATAKTVNVSGVAISGADAGNYSVASTGSTSANITRLNSVTWVGGGTGNWFDPRNWAGGAVPDLSNVANVIIPTGITVTFGTTVVAPAENAPVNIDSLGNQGSLAQTGGTLNVGNGGVTLDGLTQSGGDLTSLGPVVLGSFDQTGGNTRTGTGADFTVNERFIQTGNGTLNVGGNTSITHTSGGTVLGNISTGGNLTVTSTGGGISQGSGSAVVTTGTTTLNARSGGTPADITLTNTGNRFGGAVSADGRNINLTNGTGSLLLGNVTATGRFGADTDGNLTQQPGTRVQVGGSTQLNSNNGLVQLALAGNSFGGGLSVSDVNTRSRRPTPPPAVNPPAVPPLQLPNAGSLPPPLTMAIDVTTSGLEGSDGTTTSLPGGNSPGVQVELQRPGTLENMGLVTISLPRGTATAGTGFSFAVPRELLEDANGEPLTATLADGSPLPSWLRYDPQTQRFVASAVPDGSFPVQLLVTVGQRRAILVISERSEN